MLVYKRDFSFYANGEHSFMKYFIYLGSILFLLQACVYTQKIRSGEMAYERKQFAVAVDLLELEYQKAKDRESKAKTAYLLGESFHMLGDEKLAGEWYNSARSHKYGDIAVYKLAKALKSQEAYGKALAIFLELEKSGFSSADLSAELYACEQSIQWVEERASNAYKVYEHELNSAKLEYGAFPISENILLFSSDRSKIGGSETYKWTGNAFSDLYIYNALNNEIESFDIRINSSDNEGAACLSKDRNELYFTRCSSNAGDDFCKIMYSKRKGKSWTEPIALDFIEDGYNYGHPYLLPKGDILVFSAALADSYGQTDLYYSLNREGVWTKPVNLGAKINTSGSEKFPFYKNDTLYFSSNGLVGMGGLDVFKSVGDFARGWSFPENMEAPINSGADDYAFIIDPFFSATDTILQKGYLSSSRASKNSDDIFAFEYINHLKELDTVGPIADKSLQTIYLNLQVNQRFYPDENPLEGLAFIDLLPDAIIDSIGPKYSERINETDSKGKHIQRIDPDKEFQMLISKVGYISELITINTMDLDSTDLEFTLNREVTLNKIYTDREVLIKDIFYDYDQWSIRDDAKINLNKLVDMLNTNPNIKIVLGSHTDCRGEVDYNLDLSQKRAFSAVGYLIEQGISADRLDAKGYGKLRLAADCNCDECSEAEHQINRRTTFSIVKY